MQLTLKDLLSIFPECPKSFFRYFRESIKCIRYDFIHGYQGYFTLSFKMARHKLEELFPDISKYFIIQSSKKDLIILESRPEYKYPVEVPICCSHHLIKPIQGLKIEPVSSSFALMFLLGSLVRYKPVTWNRIIIGEKTGLGYVLEDYISSCYQKFPEYIYSTFFN